MNGKNEERPIKTERDFARAAGRHFQKARQRVLDSGQSVLYSRDGIIFRLHPDGHEEEVKRIAPPIPVERGRKIRIR